jgi:hypothetical protein
VLVYRIPDLEAAKAPDAMRLAAEPRLARLRGAGPWQFKAHSAGGCLATWRDAEIPSEDDLAAREAVTCADGLIYYRAKVPPTLADVAKDIRSDFDTDVTLGSGLVVTIALAASAPYRVRFASVGAGPPATEYGRVAREVWRLIDEQEPANAPRVTSEHPLLKRLLVLAIQQRYRVTDEALDDMDLITSEDIEPIYRAIIGSAKKA